MPSLSLNVGCGGRQKHRAIHLGDIRLDVKRFSNVNILADAHNLPFKENCFKKIFAFEVLEHLNSPIIALREMKRVSVKYGVIILTVPNAWYWRKIFRYSLRQQFKKFKKASYKEDHKQTWEVYEFHRLAFQVGLKVIDVRWLDWHRTKKKLGFLDVLLGVIVPLRHTAHPHMLFTLKSSHASDEVVPALRHNK